MFAWILTNLKLGDKNMTISRNSIQLIGNLAKAPEIIKNDNGVEFAKCSIATNESVKKGDEWVKEAEWHNLVLFGRFTKAAKYLDKGSLIFIEGKLRSNKWKDKNGNDVKSWQVIVSDLQILSSKTSSSTEQPEIDVDSSYVAA